MNGSGEGVSGSVPKKLMAWLIIAIGTSIVLAEWLVEALHSPQVGWDFPVFYIAAKLPVSLLYDRAAFSAFWQTELVPQGVPHWAAYIRPSAFAVLLRPVAYLPYYSAMWLWICVAAILYLTSVVLLIRRLNLSIFLLPATAAFFPAMAGIESGQDTALYLLCFTASILLLDGDMDWFAGLVLVICLCKFNLTFFVPVVLLAHRRVRALYSFAAGAMVVTVVSLLLTTPNSYISAISHAQTDTAGFYPVGLRGFSVAIGQPWCYLPLALLAAVCCCWLIVRLPLAQSMAVAVLGSLLISPYVTWYDSTLLVLPIAFVFADTRPLLRIAAIVLTIAVPLWAHGGGNNGPIGFMHVGVEALLLAYFAHMARLSRRAQPVPLSAVTEAV